MNQEKNDLRQKLQENAEINNQTQQEEENKEENLHTLLEKSQEELAETTQAMYQFQDVLQTEKDIINNEIINFMNGMDEEQEEFALKR